MLRNLYMTAHDSLGIHFWDLFALIAAVALLVMIIVHTANQKKRKQAYDSEREQIAETRRQGAAGNPARS